MQLLIPWFAKRPLSSHTLILTNLCISGALLISVADMNGVTLNMAGLPQSTTFGLYDIDTPNYTLIERSQDYRHPSAKPEKIHLHSPTAGPQLSAIRLRLKPARKSNLYIRSIEIQNFIGFDGKTIHRFEGDSLLNLVKDAGVPAKLENTQLIIGPVEGNVWIEIPNLESRFSPPTYRSLSALLYWQLGFLLLLYLAPGSRQQFIEPNITDALESTTIAWWVWTTLVHLFFIGILAWVIFYVHNVSELNDRTVPLNLAHKGNYAVWWSGICLFLASLIYYQLGSYIDTPLKDRWMYFSLSAVILALACDEIGSLHERVSMLGGWFALLPFALIGGGVFGYAIVRMLSDSRRRSSGILILFSLFLFIGVAGLERLEGIRYFETDWVARARLVVEEGIELLATSLLILSAAIQRGRRYKVSAGKVMLKTNPLKLLGISYLLFLGLALHLLITVVWMPYLWNKPIGEPAYLFPMFAFALLAFYAATNVSFHIRRKWLNLISAVIFSLISASQLYNIGEFSNAWSSLIPEFLFATSTAKFAWTTIPVLLWLFLKLSKADFIKSALSIGVVLLMVRNGQELFETYYIYSGIVAYIGLLLTLRNTPSTRQV